MGVCRGFILTFVLSPQVYKHGAYIGFVLVVFVVVLPYSWACGSDFISQGAITASILMSSIIKSEKHSGFRREIFLGRASHYSKSLLRPSGGVTICTLFDSLILGGRPPETSLPSGGLLGAPAGEAYEP